MGKFSAPQQEVEPRLRAGRFGSVASLPGSSCLAVAQAKHSSFGFSTLWISSTGGPVGPRYTRVGRMRDHRRCGVRRSTKVCAAELPDAPQLEKGKLLIDNRIEPRLSITDGNFLIYKYITSRNDRDRFGYSILVIGS